MPQKKTASRKKSRSGASNYVREEMHELKKGRVKNRKQAIAIGLSRARRAGKNVPSPKKSTSGATRKKAAADTKAGHRKRSSGRHKETKRTTTRRTAARKSGSKRSARKSA
jgi:hypothetical protein